MTQTNTYHVNSIVMVNDATDVSASGEAIITLPDANPTGEEFSDFSLTLYNADSSYTLAVKVEVSNTDSRSATDTDWVALTDEWGASSFTVAVSSKFAAHFSGRYRWWRVFITASSASYGSNCYARAVISR